MEYDTTDIRRLRQEVMDAIDASLTPEMQALLLRVSTALEEIRIRLMDRGAAPQATIRRESSLASFSDALATFNHATGASIQPPAPMEPVDRSLLRVFAQVLDVMTSTVVGDKDLTAEQELVMGVAEAVVHPLRVVSSGHERTRS